MLKRCLCILFVLILLPLGASALEPPDINARAVILYEATSGEILYEYYADEEAKTRLYPASTTKMMTAIVALEYGNIDDMVTVTANANMNFYEMGSSSYLIQGEEISFRDLLDYLLVASGNDAGNALAEHISGSIDGFVELMNSRARALGCTGTNFTNTHGLFDENHYSTARDLLIIAEYCMQNPTFAEIVQQPSITLPITNRHDVTTTRHNTNLMLHRNGGAEYFYAGTLGIKTGYISQAGRCLISCIKVEDTSGELEYYTVVMGCDTEDRQSCFNETIKLIDYAKVSYSVQTLLKSSLPVHELPVRLSSDRDSVTLVPEGSITALLPNDFLEDDVVLEYETVEEGTAPIVKGETYGTLSVSYNGKDYGTLNLIAMEDIERSQTLYILDKVTGFFGSTTFKIIVGAAAALIVILIVYSVLINRNRKKRKRRYGGSGQSGGQGGKYGGGKYSK